MNAGDFWKGDWIIYWFGINWAMTLQLQESIDELYRIFSTYRGNPNMDVNSSQFGQALYQGSPSATFGPQTMELGNVSGRQVEIGMKIIF